LEINKEEELAAFEFCLKVHHCCLMTSLPGQHILRRVFLKVFSKLGRVSLRKTVCLILCVVMITAAVWWHWHQRRILRRL